MIGRETRIEFGDQISADGQYLVENDGNIVASMAFNYDRKESDLRYLDKAEIENKLEDNSLKNATVVDEAERNFSEIFDELQNGKQLWKLFVFLALLFILAEVLIARFWK